MIHPKMQAALNEQINHETASAYLYLGMAGYFHSIGLDGMAQWMRVQSMEELTHAMKFFDHLRDRDGKIELKPVEVLQSTWSSPLDAFQKAYHHEQFITSKINDLVALSMEVKDFASNSMLQWFVDEQVEEEATASKIAHELEMIDGKGQGLLMIDRELGARTFVFPTQTGAN